MVGGTMHPGEVEIGAELVRRLVQRQYPRLSQQPLIGIASTGTVNVIYRLGDDLAVRLPRLPDGAADLLKEWEWLPRLAARLPLAIPEPVVLGEPDQGYPYPWAVYRWVEGDPLDRLRVTDEAVVVSDLAAFIAALRGIEPEAGPPSGREPLPELDAVTRDAIASLPAHLPVQRISRAWDRLVKAPAWDGRPVWRHGDLLPANLLMREGRLAAVLDFGMAGVGDPALDIIPAWSVFSTAGRPAFREALSVDEETWQRARAYALHQALLIIPYYPVTNPGFVRMAANTVAEVLRDLER
ncbi:MAG: aminoglycoside phosphotransferase family protein [Clostridia bacterium]